MAVKKSRTFEEAMARLDEIALLLDSGEPALDDALRLFGEGAELLAFCDEKLKTAKLTVEKLFSGAKSESGSEGDGERNRL